MLGFDEHPTRPNRTLAKPSRPTNRLSECTPQWLALLIKMRLVTPKQAQEAHMRATKQAEHEGNASPNTPPPRRRRRKPK